MRIKTIFLIIQIVFSLPVIGQEKTDNSDFRLGAGISLLGSGDMVIFNYENEINYKLNQYITSSVSINFGRSNFGVSETASFIQGNINVFYRHLKILNDLTLELGPDCLIIMFPMPTNRINYGEMEFWLIQIINLTSETLLVITLL